MSPSRKSSVEHCLTCLTRLRLAGLKQQNQTPETMTAQNQLYAQSLTAFEPWAVKAACDDWLANEDGWPPLSRLIANAKDLEETHQARRQLAAPVEHTPASDEPLSTRLLRLGWSWSDIQATPYDHLRPWMADHRQVSDARMRDAMNRLRRGEAVRPSDVAPSKPMTVLEVEAWETEIDSKRGQYLAADSLLKVLGTIKARINAELGRAAE
jgi:hypothetical protein